MSTTPLAPAQPLWFIDNLARIRVPGAETDGAYGATELLCPHGSMPPLHVHHRDDERFTVIEGEMTLFSGDAEIRLAAGESALAPRGVPHTYRVESDALRILVVGMPSGFEEFVVAASDPAAVPGLPPADRPVDPEALGREAAAVGIEILGPPGMLPTAL
jgi:mannose-6-phosphate isomerase-like protein (cupin superfamily)